jgi:isoquinoline 1-oxidoreductase beta subunit
MTEHISRRGFIALASTAGAGLALGIRFGTADAADATDDAHSSAAFAPNAWLRVEPSGRVIIVMAKSEMGQGVLTALPMIVAEELDADWNAVTIERSPATQAYPTFTGGSQSVRTMWTPLRQSGATARAMLVAAAAAQWRVPVAECTTNAGVVMHAKTSRRLGYGALAVRAASLPVPAPETVPLKAAKDFRLVGKPITRRDLPDKVKGRAIFGIDVRVPGMLVASVARCPEFGGAIGRVNDTHARAVAGVRQIVRLDALPDKGLPARVAVLADTTWAAMEGRRALEIEWTPGPDHAFDSEAMFEHARGALDIAGEIMEQVGEQKPPADPSRVIQRDYELPFLAHATMEPMNCTAHVTSTHAEVWAPTQMGGGMQKAVAKFLSLDPSAVTVHVTLLGGGFGRRAYSDFVIDAVQIAKAAKRPVKVIWSRDEDIQHDLYRTASVQRLRAELDASGKPVSWFNRVAGPSDAGYWNPKSLHMGEMDPPEVIPYAIQNRIADFVYVPAPVPLGAWRAVVNTQNAFCVESFIDELAVATKQDPVEFRLAMLDGKPRMQNVIRLAAESAGWGKPLPQGRGRGISFFDYDGTYVAQVAEVTVAADGAIRVDRVTCAFDCGQMVNPDTIRAQIEGSVAWAVSATLYGEITVKNGRTVQSNFNDYPVIRLPEMPRVDVHLVVNEEEPSGVGEPAVPGVAPAVANAVFAATGRRVRRLPLMQKAAIRPAT